MRIAQSITHRGHVVYDDGRLYQNGELVGTYASTAAAKAAATKRHKAQRAERAAVHHAAVNRIWGRPE